MLPQIDDVYSMVNVARFESLWQASIKTLNNTFSTHHQHQKLLSHSFQCCSLSNSLSRQPCASHNYLLIETLLLRKGLFIFPVLYTSTFQRKFLVTMHFSLATIATAALIFTASAAPHKGGKDRNSTDTEEQGGNGRGPFNEGSFPSGAFWSRGGAAPTGGFPSFSGRSSGPALTASSGSTSGGDSASSSSRRSSRSTKSSRQASSTFPTAAGESTLSKPMEVTDFDGGMVRFGRGVPCTSGEGGGKDAVFNVADGGSLSNVIIGADQIEGVHCAGACTITNVWWEAVCEDALTFKGNGDAIVSGGGAKGANDKVVQHNGLGTVSISNFYVEDFGKLYRSCGNCEAVSIPSPSSSAIFEYRD